LRGNGDGFLTRLAVDEEEAADHFLGLGEGAVDHVGAAAAHFDRAASEWDFNDSLASSRPRALRSFPKRTMRS